MSACEKCWRDARDAPHYRRLVKERNCTPEEQAGEGAEECRICKRKTIHVHTGEPMCGCPKDLFGHTKPRATP